ncbi:MAG TPA: hypothetical protein DFS52_20500, partial [Myxococcales bacterium]|nr:hypothetical protein [Myxococcales bacterium]
MTGSTFTVTETFATREDPDQATPAPAQATCSFVCPDGGDAAAVRCEHSAFAQSSVVEVALSGGSGLADSIRSSAATLNGGFLEAPPVVFSFRAQDPGPLALSSTSPNGEPGANVSSLSDVRFTFDRALRCETALTRFTLVDESDGSAPVAGTLACTNGTAVGQDVDGTTIVFTPSAPLVVDHTYRATALAGIAAADATVVDGEVMGKLEQDATISFVIAFEDLQIVSTTPSGTSHLAPIGTNLTLQFNQDIAAVSLVPCTPAVQTACNFWINEGSTSDQALAIDLGFVSYDNASFGIVYDPSDAANAPHLKADTLYTVTVLGGVGGVVGTNGVSHLPVDYTFSFRTSSNALIVGLTPDIDEMDVEAWAPICVEFVDAVLVSSLTEGGNQIVLTYEDAFGRTAQVPLDEANPYAIGDKSGLTGNYVCLNVTDAPIPCLAGMRRLLYASLYSVEVSTEVEIASGQRLSSPFAWDFMTRNPPEVAELRVKNSVIDEPLAKGAEDVPVNAAFVIRFAEPMDPVSLDPANIQLVAEGGSTPVAATITPDDPATPRSVMITVAPNLDHLDAGADQGRYALLLLGGSGGLTTGSGNYLESDLLVRFETSPVTHVTFSPPESEITPGIFVPLNSLDRPLHLASVTNETVYATFNGKLLGGIVAQNPLQPLSATYIAVPTYKPNQSQPYQFHSTDQVLDFRGNPVPAIDSVPHTTGNTASSTAITPLRAATYTDVSPRAPTSTTNGDQSFTLTLPIAANQGLRDRFQGTSYYATEPGEPDGTVSLEALGGAGCPDAETRLALKVRHIAGAATHPDRVHIQVARAPYMKADCQYSLKIRQYATANIYDSLSAVTGCNGL